MNPLKSWLSHQLALKCIALVVSLLLWSYVYFVFGARTVKSITLQVQFVNVSDQYVLSADPAFVEVLFSAPAHAMDQLEKGIRASIDLAGYSSGTFKRKPQITFSKGVEVENITPPLVEVSLEKLISKDFKLHPQIKGEPAKGNVMGSIELVPEYVIVRGPESIVNLISEALVPIDISNANADIFSSIEAVLLDQNAKPIENVELNQRIIKVHVPVINSNISKVIPIIPRFIGTPMGRIASVELIPPLVTLRGNGSVLENINSVSTEDININNIKDTAILPFKIVIPPETSLENPDQSFEIRITIEDETEKVFTLNKVTFRNLPDSLELIWLDESIQIRLYGPRSILNSITSLEAWVDVSQLAPGEHLLSFNLLSIPKEIIVHRFPQKIRIKVNKKNS